VKPIAAILFVGVAASAFLLSWVFTETTDDRLVRLYQELAINRVKMTMRDSNAKTENVVFHPVPGDGPEGRSYVCGSVRPSMDVHARPERFIYYFGRDTVSFFGQLPDRDLVESTTRLCNSVPISFGRFDTSGGKMSLKPNP